MARPMTPDEMLAALRKWRVPFKEYPGWRTRSRPVNSATPFGDIRGVIIHHTGSDKGQSDDYLKFLFVTGRSDLPGPLCHAATDMDGDLWLGAIGRANHAGKGSSAVLREVTGESYPGYVSELKPGADDTDGNAHFYGNEVRYDGGQPMTGPQYRAAVLFAAAVCDHYGWSALSVIGHREWTRRKPDPGNCLMNRFRTAVAAALKAGPPGTIKPPAPVQEDEVTNDQYLNIMKFLMAISSNLAALMSRELAEDAAERVEIGELQSALAEAKIQLGRIEADTDRIQ
jgi:hypothetical protein